jgi:hypothetical protein
LLSCTYRSSALETSEHVTFPWRQRTSCWPGQKINVTWS